MCPRCHEPMITLDLDGVEIDPTIVRVGREYFAMNQPNLNVVVADGRYYLAHSDQRYTVVGIDAYKLPYIPPHLATVEFFRQVRDHLTTDGVVAINVGPRMRKARRWSPCAPGP